jgi:hypothetical protein
LLNELVDALKGVRDGRPDWDDELNQAARDRLKQLRVSVTDPLTSPAMQLAWEALERLDPKIDPLHLGALEQRVVEPIFLGQRRPEALLRELGDDLPDLTQGTPTEAAMAMLAHLDDQLKVTRDNYPPAQSKPLPRCSPRRLPRGH